jgi:glycosyltransferase involved in cell wall biosynthesis
VRVLIFHGYLLHGTGSNVYNASVAEAFAKAGDEVHLLCQERAPWDLGWVDAAGDWDSGSLRVETRREPARATVYRPDIGGLLPVYVADVYEDIEARPFHELSEAEVDDYIARNVAAVREVVERAEPDVALANHLVMGPAILARALTGTGVPYAAKIHGSALEYTVKPHPRFMPFAREGLHGARGVLVGSRHTGESLWAALQEPGLQERTRLGPPGVDVERFAPREPAAVARGLAGLVAKLEGMGGAPAAQEGVATSAFARDPSEAAAALRALDLLRDRVVVYVGKLIASKGVELLLAAWPLIAAAEPRAKLLIVGFGGFRDGLHELAAQLAQGDLEGARATRGEDGRELGELQAFLAQAGADYADRAQAAGGSVIWAGRLDHHELADVLPAAEAIVVPSTFPEAFGMVAAEGAACGALPVVADHSGLAEVARALAAQVPDPVQPLLRFEVGPHAVEQLAHAVSAWLALDADVREQAREAIVAEVRARWSWQGVARSIVAAAEGRLDDLPTP